MSRGSGRGPRTRSRGLWKAPPAPRLSRTPGQGIGCGIRAGLRLVESVVTSSMAASPSRAPSARAFRQVRHWCGPASVVEAIRDRRLGRRSVEIDGESCWTCIVPNCYPTRQKQTGDEWWIHRCDVGIDSAPVWNGGRSAQPGAARGEASSIRHPRCPAFVCAWSNGLSREDGGVGGFEPSNGLPRLHDFQSCSLNHLDTTPRVFGLRARGDYSLRAYPVGCSSGTSEKARQDRGAEPEAYLQQWRT